MPENGSLLWITKDQSLRETPDLFRRRDWDLDLKSRSGSQSRFKNKDQDQI